MSCSAISGASAQARAICSARRTELRNVAQSVGTKIAIMVRIRCAAHTEGIKNQKKRTCHVSLTKARHDLPRPKTTYIEHWKVNCETLYWSASVSRSLSAVSAH